MKNKYLLLLLPVLLIISCQKEELPLNGSISGEITQSGSVTPATGIKVLLFDLNFKADKVNLTNNRKAIIDSAMTNLSGKYVFQGLKAGRYGILPMEKNQGEKINLANTTDSLSVTISKEHPEYKIDLRLVPPQNNEPWFYVKLKFKNMPNADYVPKSAYDISDGYLCFKYYADFEIYRQRWLLFLPYPERNEYTYYVPVPETVNLWHEGLGPRRDPSTKFYNDGSLILKLNYGFTYLISSVSNNFWLEFKSYSRTLNFSFPIESTPQFSTWEIDFNLNSCTLLEKKIDNFNIF